MRQKLIKQAWKIKHDASGCSKSFVKSAILHAEQRLSLASKMQFHFISTFITIPQGYVWHKILLLKNWTWMRIIVSIWSTKRSFLTQNKKNHFRLITFWWGTFFKCTKMHANPLPVPYLMIWVNYPMQIYHAGWDLTKLKRILCQAKWPAYDHVTRIRFHLIPCKHSIVR